MCKGTNLLCGTMGINLSSYCRCVSRVRDSLRKQSLASFLEDRGTLHNSEPAGCKGLAPMALEMPWMKGAP